MIASAVGMAALATVSSAQVYSSTSNKLLSSFLGSAAYEYVTDTTTDAAGNRYVVGYTYDTTYHGYITKISKKGFKLFTNDSTSSDGSYPVAVAADNAGHVYTCVPQNNTYALKQYDANSGGLNYTSAEFDFATGYPTDMAIQPNGEPVVSSDSDVLGTGSDYGTIINWDPSTGGWTDGYYMPSFSGSHIASLAVDASGGVYGAGFGWLDDTFTETAAQVLYVGSDFDNSVYPTFNIDARNEYFTEVAIDPVSQVAVLAGSSEDTGFVDSYPIIGSFYPDRSSGSLVSQTEFYPFYSYYPVGSTAQGIAIDDQGIMYMACTKDLPGSPRASVYSFYSGGPFGSDPWSLYFNFDQQVPVTDPGSFDTAYDITTDGNGCVLGVVSDLTIGLGTAAHNGIQTFTFAPTGAPIDRQFFGSPSIDVTDSLFGYYSYPRSAMSAVGGFLSIYGPTKNYQSFLYTAQLKKGANDAYRVDEDSTLTVGLAKSVLNNDGNQFKYDALSAQLVSSSVSVGIHSLTFNANGTFTATFNPNFNGVAKFNYRVKQNGAVIATNHVTINVKAKNDAPTAVDDTFNVAKNSPVSNLNVLGNDSDLDGDDITILSKTNNANATIGITSDKKYITFKPKTNFTGNVTFQYTIRDPQGLQSTANITVHVN